MQSSAILTKNVISGNTSSTGGGGVLCTKNSSPILTNNVISGNTSGTGGGGVCCYISSSPTLINNTISGNSANTGQGGGVNCTQACSPVIKNTIIAFSGIGGGLSTDGTSNPTVTYCDAYGNNGGNYVGMADQTHSNGNISMSPYFVNPAAGDFHEKSKYGTWDPHTQTWVTYALQSPCIDAGAPTYAYKLEPQPNGGRVNMGAYGATLYASKSPKAGSSSVAALTVSAASAQGLAGGRQVLVFALSAPASVQVEIVNIAGRPIRELPVGEECQAGVNTLSWDGYSAAGTPVPNGVYLVRLVARTDDGAQAQAVVTCTVRR
jgi:predicted outer membrane repeat protein